jgi:hypothetical protein
MKAKNGYHIGNLQLCAISFDGMGEASGPVPPCKVKASTQMETTTNWLLQA